MGTLILALAVAGYPVLAALFLYALREKDRHHALQIAGLLNRIQAPEHAVAEIVKDEQFEPVVLPHDESSYWSEVEHVALVEEQG